MKIITKKFPARTKEQAFLYQITERNVKLNAIGSVV